MYAALWRALPGPGLVRLAILLLLIAVVVFACFEWLFPLVASWLPYDETTVGADNGATAYPSFTTPEPS